MLTYVIRQFDSTKGDARARELERSSGAKGPLEQTAGISPKIIHWIYTTVAIRPKVCTCLVF